MVQVQNICQPAMLPCKELYLDYIVAPVKTRYIIVSGKYFSYFFIKTCCGYSLEEALPGVSNEYTRYDFTEHVLQVFIKSASVRNL